VGQQRSAPFRKRTKY
jgi:hypothetical protein